MVDETPYFAAVNRDLQDVAEVIKDAEYHQIKKKLEREGAAILELKRKEKELQQKRDNKDKKKSKEQQMNQYLKSRNNTVTNKTVNRKEREKIDK